MRVTSVIEYQGKNAVASLETKGPFFKREHCMNFLDVYLSAAEKEEEKIENIYSPQRIFIRLPFYVCAIIASVANHELRIYLRDLRD